MKSTLRALLLCCIVMATMTTRVPAQHEALAICEVLVTALQTHDFELLKGYIPTPEMVASQMAIVDDEPDESPLVKLDPAQSAGMLEAGLRSTFEAMTEAAAKARLKLKWLAFNDITNEYSDPNSRIPMKVFRANFLYKRQPIHLPVSLVYIEGQWRLVDLGRGDAFFQPLSH
jgi:hypothetical protein